MNLKHYVRNSLYFRKLAKEIQKQEYTALSDALLYEVTYAKRVLHEMNGGIFKQCYAMLDAFSKLPVKKDPTMNCVGLTKIRFEASTGEYIPQETRLGEYIPQDARSGVMLWINYCLKRLPGLLTILILQSLLSFGNLFTEITEGSAYISNIVYNAISGIFGVNESLAGPSSVQTSQVQLSPIQQSATEGMSLLYSFTHNILLLVCMASFWFYLLTSLIDCMYINLPIFRLILQQNLPNLVSDFAKEAVGSAIRVNRPAYIVNYYERNTYWLGKLMEDTEHNTKATELQQRLSLTEKYSAEWFETLVDIELLYNA